MMLRKRTSFKPNVKPSTPSQSVTSTTEPANLDPTQAITTANQDDQEQPLQQHTQDPQQNQTALVPATNDIDTPKQHIPEQKIPEQHISEQQVQAAIDQLTNQKFEPLKSLSLRNSTNKNVKLKDLLFFNPPLTKDQKKHKKMISKRNVSNSNKDKQGQQPTQDNLSEAMEEEGPASQSQQSQSQPNQTQETEHSLVPKVKMGPDGKLVLDESSTVINRKNVIKDQEPIIEDNDDVICKTNYDSYRRRPAVTSQTKWSQSDTKKFYQGLTLFGTDFSMMESLLFLGSRSRTELHKKFKREERVNKQQIDIALANRISLNSEELDDIRDVIQ